MLRQLFSYSNRQVFAGTYLPGSIYLLAPGARCISVQQYYYETPGTTAVFLWRNKSQTTSLNKIANNMFDPLLPPRACLHPSSTAVRCPYHTTPHLELTEEIYFTRRMYRAASVAVDDAFTTNVLQQLLLLVVMTYQVRTHLGPQRSASTRTHYVLK